MVNNDFERGGDVALTEKQKRFVAEYLVDLNATQAAIRAGYSEKTAGSVGNENLKKPEIQNAIQKAVADRQQRTEITQDKVLDELGKVAFSKAADYTDSTLKYSNKLRALELLGKHLGMFEGKKNDGEEGVRIIDDIPSD